MIRRKNICRLIFEGPLAGKISRGKQRTEWLTKIKELTEMRYENLVRLSQDREQWRNMTAVGGWVGGWVQVSFGKKNWKIVPR